MANQVAAIKNYTTILDEVYKREALSTCLNSPRRMARAGRNAKEIMIPKISVSGLANYTRNVGYKSGSIVYTYETKTFKYDRGLRLLADVMDVEEAGVLDCFVAAGAELQRLEVAPEGDAYTFSEIASHDGVKSVEKSYEDAEAVDILKDLRAVTKDMDEKEVTRESRYLFITPTLKGVIDDFSEVNPVMSKNVMTRFAKVVEVPEGRFYSKIKLNTGDDDQFGYEKDPTDGKPLNFLVVEKSAVIKFDKHTSSRVFSPNELESLDSYMRKYRKYGIVELFDNKLDGVYCSKAV